MHLSLLHSLAILFILGAVLAACSEPKDSFDWQGHRGCRGNLPENTIPAFLLALENPAIKTLELDVVVTKDNQVILSHEPWFSHEITTTPGGKTIEEAGEQGYNLYQMTLDTIRKYDVGLKPHPRFEKQKKIAVHKPTLAEAFAATQAHPRGKGIHYNIEIKSNAEHDGNFTPPVADFCKLVMSEIEKSGLQNSCNIQSFDVRCLQYMHQNYPNMELAFLVENLEGFDKNMALLGFIPEIYSPNYAQVTPELVKTCHTKGMKIIPWTVNSSVIAQGLISIGVDGIITDYMEVASNPKS